MTLVLIENSKDSETHSLTVQKAVRCNLHSADRQLGKPVQSAWAQLYPSVITAQHKTEVVPEQAGGNS